LLALGKPQAVISEETAKEAEGNGYARETVRNGSTKSKDGGHNSKRLRQKSQLISEFERISNSLDD
jgi:hypothetical protein